MPKERSEATDDQGHTNKAWTPDPPPKGGYLSRQDSSCMLMAVADILARGKDSVWATVESWDEAVRCGIREWAAHRREQLRQDRLSRAARRAGDPPTE